MESRIIKTSNPDVKIAILEGFNIKNNTGMMLYYAHKMNQHKGAWILANAKNVKLKESKEYYKAYAKYIKQWYSQTQEERSNHYNRIQSKANEDLCTRPDKTLIDDTTLFEEIEYPNSYTDMIYKMYVDNEAKHYGEEPLKDRIRVDIAHHKDEWFNPLRADELSQINKEYVEGREANGITLVECLGCSDRMKNKMINYMKNIKIFYYNNEHIEVTNYGKNIITDEDDSIYIRYNYTYDRYEALMNYTKNKMHIRDLIPYAFIIDHIMCDGMYLCNRTSGPTAYVKCHKDMYKEACGNYGA